MFYKWLIQAMICIHWFNPFVYLLEKEVNKACELSCDEAVIAILDDNARREYGDTLISFLKSNNFHKGSLASVTLTEGAEQLKERLGAIMNFKRKTKAVRILTGILTVCIIFGAAFVEIYPAAASTDSNFAGINPAKISASPIPEEKNDRTDTYIYDENLDFGWYLDDEDWNWDDKDWDFDWDDEDWDNNWDWDDDKAFAKTNDKNTASNHAAHYVGERGIFYDLHRSIQRAYYVYF